ncbi:hypothetical protein KAU11_10475 [Candidatus Babeliales bacterium]|nr:hypothetical protein [Candidatus Babeliales bacterium]
MDANTMGHLLTLKLKTSNYNLINFDDRERSVLLNLAQDEFTKRRTTADANAKQKGYGIDSKRELDLSSLVTGTTTFSKAAGDFMLGTEDNGAYRTPDIDLQEESSAGVNNDPYVETDFGVICSYPDEALFILSEHCNTSRAGVTRVNVPVEHVSLEIYNSNLRNTFKNPYKNKVWRIEDGNFVAASSSNSFISVKNKVGVNADGTGAAITLTSNRVNHLIPGKDYIVESYRMHYIKRPRRIVVDSISPVSQISCEFHDSVHDEIVDIAVSLAIQNSIPEQQKYQIADKEKREDE